MAGTEADRRAEAARRLLDGFSIEMTAKDVPALRQAAATLPPGTRVNVTFLGSEDLDSRVAAARAVKDLGLVPVPHISARRLKSRDEAEEYLGRLHEFGASERVFIVGGDPSAPEGPFDSAQSLIESGLLPANGVRQVGITGYPEGHPNVPTAQRWVAFDEKVGAVADQGLAFVIVTQFSFDSEPVLGWIDTIRGRGVDVPLFIGVPGPAGVKRLLGFARRFGISANAGIVKKYGLSLSNLLGSAGPDRLVADLAEGLEDRPGAGEVRLHLYAFGGLEATAAWARDFAGQPDEGGAA